MPRYDYKCTKCSKVFEITKSINDNNPVYCSCSAIAKRYFKSGGSCIIEGMGFYQGVSLR